jgi:hypothetical protein
MFNLCILSKECIKITIMQKYPSLIKQYTVRKTNTNPPIRQRDYTDVKLTGTKGCHIPEA